MILFDKPSTEQIRRMLELKSRAIRSALPVEDAAFVKRFAGMAHADIERVVVRAIKSMILQGKEELTKDLVVDALRREEQRRVDLDSLK